MAKTRVVGLDIGTTNVRAAEVEFGPKGPAGTERPKVVKFAEVPLPDGSIRDGEVVEPAIVSTAIRQLWKQAGFGSKEVVIGVGNQRVMVRDVELPAMPLPQLRASLPYQVGDLLPVAVDDAHLDFVPTGVSQGRAGDQVTGLLVAATKDTVMANVDAVENAGLQVTMVDLTALALTRSLVRGQYLDKTVAIVDIGARIATVVIVEAGVPKFVRVLPTGGHDMTEAVGRALNVPNETAEGIKKNIGIGLPVANELIPAAQAVAEVGHVLVEAVRSTLAFFTMNASGGSLDALIMSGRGSSLTGFGQYLATAARVGVVLAAPLSTMEPADGLPTGSKLEDAQRVMGVSLGLAFGVAS